MQRSLIPPQNQDDNYSIYIYIYIEHIYLSPPPNRFDEDTAQTAQHVVSSRLRLCFSLQGCVQGIPLGIK